MPMDIEIEAAPGETLLEVQIRAGLRPDAPCGGQGTCGKCQVDIISHPEQKETVLACQYEINSDLTLWVAQKEEFHILESGIRKDIVLDPAVKEGLGAAFDIGTTSVVCYLLDLSEGRQLSRSSMLNPQSQFGADVISRCEYAIANGTEPLSRTIREAMNELIAQACEEAAAAEGRTITPQDVRLITVVGNTCMHHLFLGIDVDSLVHAPYNPSVSDPMILRASDYELTVHPDGRLLMLPNIAGFVGADTVACLVATSLAEQEDWTLLIDIGTNGEMVLGKNNDMAACSTAAGPSFEGAGISCGMRGAAGAISKVVWEKDHWECGVIGGGKARGICGSGLLDLAAGHLWSGRM